MGIGPLVHLLTDLHKTGLLHLEDRRWAGEMGFVDGSLVSAAFESERGLAALDVMLLLLRNADFRFADATSVHDRNVELAENEVQDHLTAYAQGRAGLGQRIPSLDAVPILIEGGTTPPAGERFVLDRSAVRLLLEIDDRRTVDDMLGGESTSQTLKDLARLVDLGLVRMKLPDASAAEDVPNPADAAARAAMLREVASPAAAATPTPETNGSARPAPSTPAEVAEGAACPKLGFADDPEQRYSRPTSMHRCYATGVGASVSADEQRELCLSGAFATCPRYIGRRGPRSTTAERPAAPPPASPAPTTRRPVTTDPRVRAAAPAAAMTAPQTAANPRRQPFAVIQGGNDGQTRAGPSAQLPATAARRDTERRRRRLIIASAVAAWVALLVLAITLFRPQSNPRVVVVQPTPRVVTAAAPAADANATTVAAPAPAATTAPAIEAPPTAAVQPTAAATTPPATAAPTAPPLGLPVASPAPVVLVPGFHPVSDQMFTTKQPGWTENGDLVHWADGAYHLNANNATRFVAVDANDATSLGPVAVAASFRKVGGPPGGGYGLILRDQSESPLNGDNQTGAFYVAEVGDRGEVGIWRRDGDRWIDLVPWTPSTAVRPGGSSNMLVFAADGDQLSFIVNGTTVATVNDDTLPTGRVGVFVGGDGNQVALDRFTVGQPD